MGGMGPRKRRVDYRFQIVPSTQNPDRWDLGASVIERDRTVKLAVKYCGNFEGQKLISDDQTVMRFLGLDKNGCGTLEISVSKLTAIHEENKFTFGCRPTYKRRLKGCPVRMEQAEGDVEYSVTIRTMLGDKHKINGWVTLNVVTDYV